MVLDFRPEPAKIYLTKSRAPARATPPVGQVAAPETGDETGSKARTNIVFACSEEPPVKYLEFARRQKDWSQKQLGDLVRIHQSFISQLEIGTGVPAGDQGARLSRALGVPEELLLEEVLDLIAAAKRG